MSDNDDVVRIETVGKRRVYSEAEYDAAVLDADQWRQVARLTQYRLQGQLDALRKHAEAMYEALEVLADEDPCDFDHHGYCQAHGFLGPEPGCGVADAHKILDNFRAVYAKEDSDDEIDRLKEELSEHHAACMLWEREMMKAIGEDGVISVVRAIKKLKAKVADLERRTVEKPKPARPWPPKGVAVDVDLNISGTGPVAVWHRLVSVGDGWFYGLDGDHERLSRYEWRYAPAPWDIAPSNSDGPARGWVVTSSGECLWVWRRDLVVGDEFRAISTIVHVEYRENV